MALSSTQRPAHAQFPWQALGVEILLGCFGLPKVLEAHGSALSPPLALSYQANEGRPYPLAAWRTGIDLMLRCINPSEAANTRQWGLATMTLSRAALQHAWTGSEGQIPTLSHAEGHWGPPIVAANGLAVFEAIHPAGRAVAVHCLFDTESLQLWSLTLIPTDEWTLLALPAEARNPDPPAGPGRPDTGTAPGPVTCGSQARTPKTGVYEGWAPADHPQAAYYNAVPGRFVFRKEGEAMICLGVVPFADEARVTWTWLRETW